MVKKGMAFGTVISVLLALVPLLGGCDGQQPTPTPVSTPTATPTHTPTPTPTPTPVETLEQILGRAMSLSYVKYDMATSISGQAAQVVTVRWKANKVRFDITMNGVPAVLLYLSDNRTQIAYLPSEKKGEQQSIPAGSDSMESSSPAEMAKDILKQNPATLGSESVDGKAALLIEGTGEDGNKYRAWIDKEHGFPLRLDTWTAEGKTTTEWKNLEFFYIPDSMFEVPPGVKITTVPPGPVTPTPSKVAPTELPVTVPRLYINPDFRYSIEVLEGWTIDDSDKSNLRIRSADRTALVQIFAYTATSNLDTWVRHTIDEFRAKGQDYQELSRTKYVLPGGLPAYSIDAKWTTKGTTFLSGHLSVLTVKTNREIELITGSPDTSWDKYKTQLERIAYSLAMGN